MFDDLVTTVQEWLAASSGWAPVVVFVITLLESLPGISILVPATALLLATGVLLGTGSLDPVPIVLAAIGGAIVGDALGFWLSRAYGPRIVRRLLPRSQYRAYAGAVLLFRRYGWAAIFFGRFLGPVRAVAPLIAGIARMREWQFQAANVGSALVWVPAMLLPGYGAARGAEAAGLENQPLAIIGAVAVVAVLAVLGRHWLRRRRAGAAQGAVPNRARPGRR